MTSFIPLPDADDPITLMALFNTLFMPTMRTCLVRGGDEPLYLPADDDCPTHRIIFARGYFSSALHEISHWCIAGPARRQLEDYGYWYIPDGRDQHQQDAFERVEVKPQAIEWCLAKACGRTFHVSVDNLDGDVEVDREAFTAKVAKQSTYYRQFGLPSRAEVLSQAMIYYYRHGKDLETISSMFLPMLAV